MLSMVDKKRFERNDQFSVVEAIISLPGELFFSTTIPVSIWVLNKAKMGKKGDVLFIDASSCEGNMIKRGLRELTIENVSDIVDVYRGSISNQASLNISNIRSAFVNFNEIVKGPVDLNPEDIRLSRSMRFSRIRLGVSNSNKMISENHQGFIYFNL